MFHGFTGTPYEVAPLGHFLASHHVRAVGPLLPGHGTTPSALAATGAAEVLDTATRQFLDLSRDGPVFVAGLSMGALVATCLAAAHAERVRGLVLMAPALVATVQAQWAIALARGGLARWLPDLPKASPGGDCGDPDGRARNPTYRVIPLGALPLLGDLQDAAKAALPQVLAPTLVMHGARDRTIPWQTSETVAQKLTRASWVEMRVFPLSQHLLPLDVEREQVLQHVLWFTQRFGRFS
jgi:carboxylesterase